jgi:putative copper resistance protein D
VISEESLSYLVSGATVCVNLALAMVIGGLASDIRLSANPSGWGRIMARRACCVRRGGFYLGAGALVALCGFQAALMSGGVDRTVGTVAWTLIKNTHFGHAWTAGLVGWSVTAFAAWSIHTEGVQARRCLIAGAGLSLFVWSRSVVSHAGSLGDWSRYIVVDWIHLVLVSLWVGIVILATTIKLPAVSSTPVDQIAAARWVARLSSTATVALVGIVLTGTFKSWNSLPSMASLWLSAYGLLLSAKVGLVLVAATIGGYNRFIVLPPLLRDLNSAQTHASKNWRDHFALALRLEICFLILALIAAAVLSNAEPPMDG